MGTNYIAPIWRMPRNANNTPVDKLSNYSIDFSGSDYINCGTGEIVTGEFTVSMWIKRSLIGGDSTQTFFSKADVNGSRTFACYMNKSAGYLQFYVSNTGSIINSKRITTSETITDENWHHLVFINGGDSDLLRIYIDGIEATTAARTGISNLYSSSIPNIIGNSNVGSNDYSGSISEVAVFDYALDSPQVGYLYNLNNPMVPGTVNLTAPVAYWPLGDNSSPNANAGYPNISIGADSVFDFTPNDYVSIGDSDSLSFGDSVNDFPFSISGWFYFDATSSYGLVSKYGTTTGSREWMLYTTPSNFRLLLYDTNGNNAYADAIDTTIVTNEWYHVVATYNGAGGVPGARNGIQIYINGQAAVMAALGGASYQAMHNTGRRVDLGSRSNTSYFDGQMSNVQIWDVELSGPNALELYNNGQPLMTGTQPQEDNLKVWWKLNQSANWEAITANTWQIPDNRSAYPQSFNFSKTPQEYINLGKEDFFDGNNEMTFSVWINKKDWSSTGFEGIISKYGLSGAAIQYRIAYPSSAGKLQFYLQGGPSGGPYAARIDTVTLTSAQQASEWLHICWRHNANTGVSEVIFNGDYTNLVSLSNIAANPYAQPQTTTTNMIGNVANGLQPFDGAISNYQRFNNFLNNAAVEVLYNDGVPYAAPGIPSEAWYKLDNTELFDGTNWEVENQAYPANFDSALDFDGSNNNYIIADIDGTGGSGSSFELGSDLEFTVSFWFKRSSSSIRIGLFQWANALSSGSPFLLIQQNSDNLRAFYDGGYRTNIATSQNIWYHISITRTASDNTLRGYLNGSEWFSYDDGGTPALQNTATGVYFGNGYQNYFTGQISNGQIWNTALPATGSNSIETLYNNGTPLTTAIVTDNLKAWWKLDNTTTGIQDSVGSNNGTNNGATKVNTFVSTEAVTSSGLTEQNLVNNNVSVLNGESVGMNTTNLVQSNLNRTQPFSNYSMFYDAVDVYSTFDTQISLDASDNFTWSFWIKPVYNSISDMVLLRASATSITANNTMLLTYSGGNWRIKWDNASGNFTTGYVMPNNEWSHVALSITQGTGTRYAYINGVQDSANAAVTGITSQWLGFSSENTTNDFEGYLSQCAYWDTNLSTTELAALYNNGVPQDLRNFNVQPTQYWPMNQDYSYWDGSVWTNREIISGNDSTTVNTAVINAFVGNAPGSEANGTGTNLTIADLKGNMYASKNNAYSINMADYADGVTNPANSGRSTEVPSV